LRGLFEESIQQFDESEKLHQTLEKQKSAAAALAVAFHVLREGRRTDTLHAAMERLQLILMEFLSVTIRPLDYALVSSALYRLMKKSDVDVLRESSTSIPLALGLAVRVLMGQSQMNEAKEVFHKFLLGEKSEMSVEDKAKLFPVYVDFLRKGGGSIEEIRCAERGMLEVERKCRVNLLKDRREVCKVTSEMQEVLCRWMDYFRESDPVGGNVV
jgi:hypothetical protein